MKAAKIIGVAILILIAVGLLPATRDALKWRFASSRDKARDYAEYLAAWPSGRHSAEGRARYDERTWADAQAGRTLESYRQYEQTHPSGAHLAEARTRIEDLTWQQSTNACTVQSLGGYLKSYDTGRFAAEARTRIEDLAWQQSTNGNTIQSLEGYLKSYGSGRFAPAARTRIEDLKWRFAQERNAIALKARNPIEAKFLENQKGEGFIAFMQMTTKNEKLNEAIESLSHDTSKTNLMSMVAFKSFKNGNVALGSDFLATIRHRGLFGVAPGSNGTVANIITMNSISRDVARSSMPTFVQEALDALTNNIPNPIVIFGEDDTLKMEHFSGEFHAFRGKAAENFGFTKANSALLMPTKVPTSLIANTRGNLEPGDFFQMMASEPLNLMRYVAVKPMLEGKVTSIQQAKDGITVEVTTVFAGTPYALRVIYSGLDGVDATLRSGNDLSVSILFAVAKKPAFRFQFGTNGNFGDFNPATMDVENEAIKKSIATITQRIKADSARIEDLTWQRATNANSIKSLRDYAEAYPNGRFLAEAQRMQAALRVDDTPFSSALQVGTETALNDFLREFSGHMKEAEAREVLKDLAEGHDIFDLLSEKKIEVETTGSGIQNISMRIRKLVPYPLTVRIPIGSYFVSANQSSQNMVATAGSKVRLARNEWQGVSPSVACANRPRNIPRSKDTFSVQRSPQQGELTKLMPILNRASVGFATEQAAVWIVTDDAD